MNDIERKIVSLDELLQIREQLRQAGKRVVQCHGCFDIVHPGHVRYLKFARNQGDVLVVTVSGDAVVAKGPDRPYIHENLRLENLAALESVDYVCLDQETWAGPILDKVRPDVYVKGKEYERNADPRFLKERDLVEGYGGQVIFSSGDVVYSSSYILSQFRDRFRLDNEKTAIYCQRHGVTRTALNSTLKAMRKKRVLVLADAILDHYIHCEAIGIASDTPMLTVSPMREDWYVGAGGLIAAEVVALGAHATFMTVLGEGPHAEQFRDSAKRMGIEVMAVHGERPVYVKSRYLVDERKVFKVDIGTSAPLSTAGTRDAIAAFEKALADHDAVIVTDFGYGLFNAEMLEAVQRLCSKAQKPYYADVSSRRVNVLRFKQPRLAAPTEEELRFAFADNESGLSHLASRYFSETGAQHLVLTMGKRGAMWFDGADHTGGRLKTEYLPAFAQHPVDAAGAGDVFLSTLALADLAAAPTSHAMYLGNCAAAIHVSQLGNAPVPGTELEQYIEHRSELTA
jgi:rfaE bifunctional protein kinase chain/domain/rfaE bifunctional protein nucleotidyltransferase chain/domain